MTHADPDRPPPSNAPKKNKSQVKRAPRAERRRAPTSPPPQPDRRAIPDVDAGPRDQADERAPSPPADPDVRRSG